MKPSKSKSEIMQRHEDNAADALLFWTNCTTTTCGPNLAVNLLLQALRELLEKSVKPDRVDEVERILSGEFAKTYDYIRASGQDDADSDSRNDDSDEDLPEAPASVTTTATKKVIH